MERSIDFRLYEPGDEGGIVKLLEDVFHGWPHHDIGCSPVEHWRWKYLDNPMGLNAVSLAVSDGKIVGCDHGFLLKVKIGDKCVRCYQGTDSAVHRDFRGKGIWSRMNEVKDRHIHALEAKYCFWATTSPVMIQAGKNRGYPSFPQPVYNFVRIIDYNLHEKNNPMKSKYVKRYGYYILKYINKINNSLNHRQSKYNLTDKIIVKDKNTFDGGINHFWDNIKEEYNFIVVKDKEYLNWRYCDPRSGSYLIKQAEVDGEILGYIVIGINRYNKEYPMAYIVDILTYKNRLDVMTELIKEAIRYIDGLSINITHSWAIRGQPYLRVLYENCFLDSRVHLHVGYRLISDDFVDELQNQGPDQLHIHLGDTDWI